MGMFYTLSSWEIKAIASFIPIYLHLNKVSRRHHLIIASLPRQHAINLILNNQYLKKTKHHQLSIIKAESSKLYLFSFSVSFLFSFLFIFLNFHF